MRAVIALFSRESVQGLAILAGAILGYGLAEGLGALKALPIQQAIAADNFVTFCIAMWTAALWFFSFEERLNWSRDERLFLKYSIPGILVCLAMHRGFWEPWWILKGLEVVCTVEVWQVACKKYGEAAAAYNKEYVLLSTLAQAGWWFFMWTLMTPWYERRWGFYWPYYAIAITIAIWLIGFQITDVFSFFLRR